MRDKLNNLVLFDKATYDKLCKEVPNYKLITPAVVSERLKIRGSLARAALQELLSKGEHSEIKKTRKLLELIDCLLFLACPAAFLQHLNCPMRKLFLESHCLNLHFRSAPKYGAAVGYIQALLY